MLRARVGVALSLVLATGCGGGDGNDDNTIGGGASNGQGGAPGGGGSSGNPFVNGGEGGIGGVEGQIAERKIVSLRIEPADAVIEVGLGASIEQAFKAYAVLESAPDQEIELTAQSVFYVPDNYLVASFPANGASTLTTRLPASDSEPPQRGGVLTVQAQAASIDGEITTATTTLTVKLSGQRLPTLYSPQATPALPDDPAAAFTGELATERAPELVYPNDGVLLPPNLGRLEVHFRPGAAENSLFELRFQSDVADLVYYTRCYADPNEFEPGSCAFFVSDAELEQLASSNQGRGPVTLSVRGSDEAGTFGESANFSLEFAEKRIDGAVYYWTASSPPSIMRFDFGSGQSEPETFVRPSDVPGSAVNCVGCHALSRQGDKVIFGLNGPNPNQARLAYVSDMSRALDDSEFFTYAGAQGDANAMLNGSFNPDGSEFVAVPPVVAAGMTAGTATPQLFFHDGNTGERFAELDLPVIPNNPDWSPAGDKIVFSAFDGPQYQRIQFLDSGISYIQRTGDTWDAANPVVVVPPMEGKNRFNPAFLPGGDLLFYSEVDQSSYGDEAAQACDESNTDQGRFCNGYSDPGAKTWIVAPEAGATPVFLAHAASPGVADGMYPRPQNEPPTNMGTVGEGDLMDTFPRPSPFEITHRGQTLSWFTVGSQRRAGLRKYFPNGSVVSDPASQALLWMFALDTARVKSGEDGSYPGFFLPFQDLQTSNHMAQWTERIVSDNPPPPPPAPPPPAPPPPPVVR
jgi:hypothetical protein